MAFGLFSLACLARAPRGKLVYCSYSSTGMAGLGKDYCELIADPLTGPGVSVVLHEGNRFGDPEVRAEYPVTAEEVRFLQDWLSRNKIHKLNGYCVEEPMEGGRAYRIHMEYDSGDQVDARWYGHGIKAEALAAYDYIESFFSPWRERAEKDSEPVVECLIESVHMGTRAVNACRLLCQPGFVPAVVIDLNVNNIQDDREYHGQYDIDSESVRRLQQDLAGMGVSRLGDYTKDDYIEGGTRYQVMLVYASGRRQTLSWHTTRTDAEASAVYDLLDDFFAPWREKARNSPE